MMVTESELRFYESILPELQVVFDVGCRNDNVFYDLNPDLEIHLFDPKRPSVDMHGHFNQIALGSKQGRAKYYPEYSSLLKRNLKGNKWEFLTHKYIEIQVDTIDDYCKKRGIKKIDLLKIDAEGSDYNVLLGAKKMLPNIKYIQFEHWNDDLTGKIKALLSDYDVTELGGKPMNYKAIR